MGILTREQIRGLIKERNMKTTDDISAMSKELFGDTLQEMLEAELDTTLGYEKNEPSNEKRNQPPKWSTVKRPWSANTATAKLLPRDRDGEHEPFIVKKASEKPNWH